MELLDVLRQREAPRGTYFLTLPTPYGPLDLDLTATPETALAQAAPTPDDLAACVAAVAAAERRAEAGDTVGAATALQDAITRWPTQIAPYRALYLLYRDAGNAAAAEYRLKQWIALEPTPPRLAELARFLGEQGRLTESAVVSAALWAARAALAPALGRSIAGDYLVTLSRQPDPARMRAVADAAITAYGGDSRLLYQRAYADWLAGDRAAVRAQLATILPALAADDPLRPRFVALQRAATEGTGAG